MNNRNVIVDSYNITSALGLDAAGNFDMLLKGYSGVEQHVCPHIDEQPIWASLVDDSLLQTSEKTNHTHYEKLLISSISEAKNHSAINLSGKDTIFIFSTTKGNISLLESEGYTAESEERLSLHHSAKLVSEYFGNPNEPIIISNACISGVVALLYARRILQSGLYKNAVVTGADTISKFVYSGFQSFQALSPGPCLPFSEARNGINLGEAGATIILSTHEVTSSAKNQIIIGGGSISNDSNHISGPSRTGIELSEVINTALHVSGLTVADIDFISAHGTATPYNDEMEARAFHLSGLGSTPVNSLKGYFGHTLGAAGIVESVISIMSLIKGIAIPSKGFQSPGVTPALNIIETPIQINMNHCLKTASGFGGCNAAIIFSKN